MQYISSSELSIVLLEIGSFMMNLFNLMITN